MADGIISTILAGEFTRETETIRGCSLDGNGIMNKVDIAACPLFVVLDESIMEVTLGKIVSTVLVVAYKLN